MLAPDGNLSGVDAYFFGLSGTTESGLNVVDVNKLQLYQQLVIYIIPILGNMQVVSILILMVRFYWFTKYLKAKAGRMSQPHRAYTEPARYTDDSRFARDHDIASDSRIHVTWSKDIENTVDIPKVKNDGHSNHSELDTEEASEKNGSRSPAQPMAPPGPGFLRKPATFAADTAEAVSQTTSHITFAPSVLNPIRRSTLPADQHFDELSLNDTNNHGEQFEERGRCSLDPHSPRAPYDLSLTRTKSNEAHEASVRYRNRQTPLARSRGLSPDRLSFHRVVSNVFVLGGDDITPGIAGVSLKRARTNSSLRERSQSRSRQRKQSRTERLKLSAHAILGRNSNFVNLSEEDRDRLGGIEYRSLKLLLKIVVTYYVSLHLIGIVCLTPWIHKTSESKYREYLASVGVNATWWYVKFLTADDFVRC